RRAIEQAVAALNDAAPGGQTIGGVAGEFVQNAIARAILVHSENHAAVKEPAIDARAVNQAITGFNHPAPTILAISARGIKDMRQRVAAAILVHLEYDAAIRLSAEPGHSE